MDDLFVDTDIILDLLAKREPFYPYAAELFSLADSGKINIYVTPIIITNIHYILRKAVGKDKAIQNLLKLKLLVKILAVDEKIIELALASGFSDFEDAVQYYTARENDIPILLTRNTKDFKKAGITIMTAEEYVKVFLSKT